MNIGERIKKLREEQKFYNGHKLTGAFLAKQMGITQAYQSAIELGKRDPSRELLNAYASFFNVSVDYLLGNTDAPRSSSPAAPQNPAEKTTQQADAPESAQRPKMGRAASPNASYVSTTAVPLLSRDFAASCGCGNGYFDLEAMAEGVVYVLSSSLRYYDDLRPPFAVRVEGDSMQEAGITEDSIIVVNPADEVRSGDPAFVIWNDSWFVKWVIWDRDGAVTLKSSNPAYDPIHIDKELAQDAGWFRVVGKVVATVKEDKPRGAF